MLTQRALWGNPIFAGGSGSNDNASFNRQESPNCSVAMSVAPKFCAPVPDMTPGIAAYR